MIEQAFAMSGPGGGGAGGMDFIFLFAILGILYFMILRPQVKKQKQQKAMIEALKKGEEEYPLIMSSGLHFDGNANTQMRDPAWNEGKTYHWFRMHPDDASQQGLENGQIVRVITEAGQEQVELKIDATTRPGYALMPHGFGLVHNGIRRSHREKIHILSLLRVFNCAHDPDRAVAVDIESPERLIRQFT